MRTYDAINKVSNAIIEDGFCEAILVKGSIGRGDDDAYSDVDMYVVVSEEKRKAFLDKRLYYLSAYMEVVYSSNANFVAEQVIAIYEDGLHFDLYTVTFDTLPHRDKAKIIYDPSDLLKNYTPEMYRMTGDEIVALFNDALYYFVEADAAYCRKNYPWTACILQHALANASIAVRYLFDKDYAYLGLKKINEILPTEQYSLIEKASHNLNRDGFQTANSCIIKLLDYAAQNLAEELKPTLNYKFFNWTKNNINTKLFLKS